MRVAIHTPDGRIHRLLTCAESQVDVNVQPGEAWVEAPDDVRDDTHYVSEGACVVMPQRPSPLHEWDWASRSWRPDLERARERKRLEIERERDRRIAHPVIVYDGANIDADARAQDNLKRKLLEVGSRLALNDPLPADRLVWRDADNRLRTFPDMITYKAWLDGLAAALGERHSAAYAWSWQKKEWLAAASFDEILAFDALADSTS